MGRLIAITMILLGVYFFGHAAYDDHRGIAVVTSPSRSGLSSTAVRSEEPAQFRGLMAYERFRATLALCSGLIIHGLVRRAEKSGPVLLHSR